MGTPRPVRSTDHLTEIDLAWLAGLFEGEGCICITGSKRGRKSVVLSMNMTDQDVMERVNRMFPMPSGQLKVRQRFSPDKSRQWKTQYAWYACNRTDVKQILELLLPQFGSRRRAKALEALAFMESMPDQQRDTVTGKYIRVEGGEEDDRYPTQTVA
jgi:hypothetical protein